MLTLEEGWQKLKAGTQEVLTTIKMAMAELEVEGQMVNRYEAKRKQSVENAARVVKEKCRRLREAVDARERALLQNLADWERQGAFTNSQRLEGIQHAIMTLKVKEKEMQDVIQDKGLWFFEVLQNRNKELFRYNTEQPMREVAAVKALALVGNGQNCACLFNDTGQTSAIFRAIANWGKLTIDLEKKEGQDGKRTCSSLPVL